MKQLCNNNNYIIIIMIICKLYIAAMSVENRVLLTINSDKTIVDLQILVYRHIFI